MRKYKQIRLIEIRKDEDTVVLNKLLRYGYEIKDTFYLLGGGYKFLLEATITDKI